MDRSSITGSYELEGVISLELSIKQLPDMSEDEFGLVGNKVRELLSTLLSSPFA